MKPFLSAVFFLQLLASIASQSAWHYLPNAPVGFGRIEDVFFLNSQLGWSAAANGKIHKTTDAGQTWDLVYSANVYFRCIEFYDENIGYAGTLDNRFLRSTDGGNTWVNLAPGISPAPKAVCGISIVDSLYAYAVGEWDSPGFVLKTTNGGTAWESTDMSQHAKALVDVLFLSRDTGFVSGQSPSGRAIILHTTDGGESWTKVFESSAGGHYVWKLQQVTPEFWVGSIQGFSSGGKFAKSYDGGLSWTEHATPIPDMQGIGFATPQQGWVGGYVSGFYETTDGGESWTFQNFGGNFNRFYFLDSTLAYASGYSVFKYADTTATSGTLLPKWPTNEDDGFEVKLSPNPGDGFLNIEFYLPVRDNLRMGIYRADGAWLRDVYHERGLTPGSYQFRTECGELPAGAYFLGVQRNHGLYFKPFIRR